MSHRNCGAKIITGAETISAATKPSERDWPAICSASLCFLAPTCRATRLMAAVLTAMTRSISMPAIVADMCTATSCLGPTRDMNRMSVTNTIM